MQSLSLESKYPGLSSAQAEAQLRISGENEIEIKKVTALQILGRQFLSPLVYLLILAAIISFSTSDTVDGVVIVIIIAINTWLGFRQEFQANQVYTKLVSMISSNVTVMRNGSRAIIHRKQLVPGDILILKLGDLVAADCLLLEQNSLIVDESALTGESLQVLKHVNTVENEKDKDGVLYSGSYISKGTGIAKVFATGTASKFGEIVNLSTNTEKKSEYEQNLSMLSRGFMVIAVVFLVGLFIAHLLLRQQENLTELLLFTLAIAITIIPEALPVVAAITLASQADDLAKKGVLVKRGAAIEDLGNIDVLCTDKTGTLTENRMRVAEAISEDPIKLAKYAYLGSFGGSDPFDDAVNDFVAKYHEKDVTAPEVCEDIPFNPHLKFSGREFPEFTVYKGAPEYILNHSATDFDVESEMQKIAEFSAKGYRALSLAVKTHADKKMHYLGTYLLSDPIKSDAKETVADAAKHGIQIKIITGDSSPVAIHVAKAVDLINDASEVIEAGLLNFHDPIQLQKQVAHYKVFTRADPLQKFSIIQALQATYHVGYLGDGINDAPSLKLAHAAIVVDSASDVAKATADIIILSPSLDVIIDGIIDGRKAFENIDKYLKQTLISNFGNFFTIGFLSLFTSVLPMLPIQILLNNLIVDIPEIALSQDNVDRDGLRRPKQHNLKNLLRLCVQLGLVSSAFDFLFFAWATASGFPAMMIQGMWFTYSTFEEIMVMFIIRTRKSILSASRAAKIVVYTGAGAFILTLVLSLVGIPQISIVQISLPNIILLVGLAGLCVAVSEFVKVHFIKAMRYKQLR